MAKAKKLPPWLEKKPMKEDEKKPGKKVAKKGGKC